MPTKPSKFTPRAVDGPPSLDSGDDTREAYDELRQLLVGDELEKLERLRARLEAPEDFAREVGEVLPRAMEQRSQRNEELSAAMVPTVEEILRLSIKKDINRFADALFPVIGPAIRKSIRETFREMIQALNRTLEQSLSSQGIRWRLEAWRTGIPFAQIALLHSLVYRVEQVFLIHRETGLLLSHLGQEEIGNGNADLVSSMLGAINDFVGDSFAGEDDRTLNRVEIGELTLWIECGPDAILALAVRGEAPNDLRTRMQETLEKIQLELDTELSGFAGDTQAFEHREDLLDGCMQAQYQEQKKSGAGKAVAVLVVIGLTLLAWAWLEFDEFRRQQAYRAAFEAEPGYVVTRVDERDGRYVLYGLRDPLARPPGELFDRAPLPADAVSHEFTPYQSLDAVFVERRARLILAPPATVELALDGSRLVVSGRAGRDWQAQLQQRAPLIAGVDSVDASALRSEFDPAELEPPPGVTLRLDGGVLRVAGRASRAWRERLRVQAPRLPGVDSLDDSALAVEFEADMLEPPPGVAIRLDDGVLRIAGEAEQAWIESLDARVTGFDEIRSVDTGALINLTERRRAAELERQRAAELERRHAAEIEQLERDLRAAIEALERERILFDVGASLDSRDLEVERIAARLREIRKLAGKLSREVLIEVRGYSDSVGNFDANAKLSRERARSVAAALIDAGIDAESIASRGLDAPVAPEKDETERRNNRRVDFRIIVE